MKQPGPRDVLLLETNVQRFSRYQLTPIDRIALVRRGSLITIASQVVSGGLTFAFSVLLARLFHAGGTGMFFEAIAIFAIASNVADLGADDGLQWLVPLMHRKGDLSGLRAILIRLSILVLGVGAGIGTCLFIWARPIAEIFAGKVQVHSLAEFIRVFAFFVPLAALGDLLLATFRGMYQYWPLFVITALGVPLTRIVLLVGIAVLDSGTVSIALAWSIPLAVGIIISLLVVVHRIDENNKNFKSAGSDLVSATFSQRTFWSVSAPRGLASFFILGLVWIDVLLVGALRSVRTAGIYAVANRYLLVLTMLIAAIGSVFATQISPLVAEGRLEELQNLYQRTTAWIMLGVWPIAILIALYAPVMMGIFGHGFGHGVSSLQTLAVMMLFVSATGNNSAILFLGGKATSSLVIAIFTLGMDIGLNLLWIPHFGILGAAMAWASSLITANVIINLLIWYRFHVLPFSKTWLIVAIGSVTIVGGLGLTGLAVDGPHFASLIATIAVAVPLYVLYLVRYRSRLFSSRPAYGTR